MKIKAQARVQAIFLLLVYLISSNPFVQFHHHNDTHVAFEKANACEKRIYFPHADIDECCDHEAHITQSFLKCVLCDHHATSSFLVNVPFFVFSSINCPEHHKPFYQSFISTGPTAIDNKGPPFLFSFLG